MLSPIIQVSIATAIVLVLILYSGFEHQKNRNSWVNTLNDLHNLVSETEFIIWETPIYYSSENYFKLLWKSLAFEGSGLLCQLETEIIFVGYLQNSQYLDNTINVSSSDRTYVDRIDLENGSTFVRCVFDRENTEIAWIGRSFWVNGGISWFALSIQGQTHYFSVNLLKRFIFGSKSATTKVYNRLTKFL